MKLPRLFAKPEVKESQAHSILVLNPGQPVWTPRDYKSFAEEAYVRNVIAYQAINKIAEAVSSVRWVAYRGETEVTQSPALDLINNPNPTQSGREFIEAKIGYLMISGNAYDERIMISGQPREMYTHRPDRMKVVPGQNGTPKAYIYEVASSRVTWQVDDVGKSDIRHMRLFNPLNDWYGQAPVEAAAYAIDQHNEAMKWVQALLQNSARPSGALVSKGDALTDEQYNRLKAQMEMQYQGGANAGRPMLLEGGLDWKEMGLSPTDMGVIDSKNSAARDISLAFGVPPQLLGIPGDNTYSNYSEARLSFWEDTIIPLVDRLAEEFTAFIGEPYGVEIRADMDQIPAIVDKRRTLWEMVNASTVLTINEKREAMGYDPIAGGDQVFIGMGQIGLGDAALSTQDALAVGYGAQDQ
ncbi:COG4695 Phage-related protein [uncultured Caudovirales phage]|uniref:COG4695 Phage-related protein n=1 Tax=uncultured Caudovirales phage TaxID=2100421 RepID=A0A6J5NKP8_9CAUD|nr:COG4695 Phage-related protein [uncultured Caudovirales phage]